MQNQEMIVEKEMFLGVDGKQVETEMIECGHVSVFLWRR